MAHVISRTEAGCHTSGDTGDGVTSWRMEVKESANRKALNRNNTMPN